MGILRRRRTESPAGTPAPIRAVVTGLGPVSAIGCGRRAFWESLIAGRHGFGPITLCDASRSPSQVAAEVRGFKIADYVEHGAPLARWTPRSVQLALAAAVLALHDAELDLDACEPDRLGLIIGTGVGNLEVTLGAARTYDSGEELSPDSAFTSIHHSAACVLSSFFNLRGPTLTVSTGCNSGIDAIGQALRVVQAGAADAMLVIGTDCEVVPEVLSSLNASGSLSTKFNDEPGRASRPFDADRDGNVIGEGAGALLVESETHALERQARTYARLAGYHMAAAGGGRKYSHDRPELDPSPAARAMERAIHDAGWVPGNVDFVNANGSASRLYDPLEARALEQLFGERFPALPVHSIKSMLGQHGAGSSALQCVTACLSIRRGGIPPTINHERTDPACGALRVVTEATECLPKQALVHSIGLGGFYFSSAAFEWIESDDEANLTGKHQVRWSEGHHHRHQPAEKFRASIEPWKPHAEFDVEGTGTIEPGP